MEILKEKIQIMKKDYAQLWTRDKKAMLKKIKETEKEIKKWKSLNQPLYIKI